MLLQDAVGVFHVCMFVNNVSKQGDPACGYIASKAYNLGDWTMSQRLHQFIEQNVPENVVFLMVAISSRPPCVIPFTNTWRSIRNGHNQPDDNFRDILFNKMVQPLKFGNR